MPNHSLADWLTGDDDMPPDPPRAGPADDDIEIDGPRVSARLPRRRLWLVAAVAWSLVAALAVSVLTGPSTDGEPAAAPALGADVHPSAGTGEGRGGVGGAGVTGEGGPGVGGAGVTGEAGVAGEGAGMAGGLPGGESVTVHAQRPGDDAMVASAAVLTVRLAETTYEEDLGTSRYVDLAVPAGVTWLGDLAVVTVDAVVLDGDGQGWSSPRAVRYVQPMRVSDGDVVPAGRAWTVPTGGGAPAPPPTEPVDDPELAEALAAAVGAAGYEAVEIRGTARAGDRAGLFVVTVEARAPGEPGRRVHRIWIGGQDALHVLGTETSGHVNPLHEREHGP